MINGRDIVIATPAGSKAMDLALRAAKKLWPGAVVEDAETARIFDPFSLMSSSGASEVLVYKDAKSAARWREIGEDASLAGTLIHVIMGKGAITVVVDTNPHAELEEYLRSLHQSLRQDIFCIAARTREAA
jgi:hypothetical protein